MKVGFIGTGNMGGALAHAAAQSPAPAELLLSNRTPEKAQALAQQLGATVSDNETIAQTCWPGCGPSCPGGRRASCWCPWPPA